jgi:hypothetical protein
VGTISPILVVTEIMFPLCFDRRYTFIPLRRPSTYTLDLDLHAGRPLPLRLPPSLGLSASALSRPYGHRPLVRQSFLFAFNQTSHTSMLLHGSVHGGGYQVKAKIRLIRESRCGSRSTRRGQQNVKRPMIVKPIYSYLFIYPGRRLISWRCLTA